MNEKIPIEYKRLYNIPFCSLIIHWIVQGYEKKRNSTGMPSSLLFIGYSLVINPKILDILKKANQIKLISVIESNPEITVRFAERMESFCNFFLDGLLFSIACENLSLTKDSYLHAENIDKIKNVNNQEMKLFKKASMAIGKELGSFHDVATVYSILGVKP